MSKKFKRFSLDQQQTLESNIYRSSMAIVPNNNLNTSIGFKSIRDESNNDAQQHRTKVIIKKCFF